MKKLFMTMLSILACGAAQALPVGNPSEASLLCDGMFWEGSCCLDMCDPCTSWCDALSFRMGYYGDFVFDRHLELDGCDTSAKISKSEINTNALYVAANMWDRADLFLVVGASNFCLSANAKDFGHPDESAAPSDSCLTLETETDWSWGVGVRATLWECGCTSVGGVASYMAARPDINHIKVGCVSGQWPSNCIDFHYTEWQVALGVSHRINMLVPYMAIKFSKVKIDLGDAVFTTVPVLVLPDLTNQKDVGFVLGVSLVECEKAAITVEGRFSDEKALYVNGQFRF